MKTYTFDNNDYLVGRSFKESSEFKEKGDLLDERMKNLKKEKEDEIDRPIILPIEQDLESAIFPENSEIMLDGIRKSITNFKMLIRYIYLRKWVKQKSYKNILTHILIMIFVSRLYDLYHLDKRFQRILKKNLLIIHCIMKLKEI